MSGIVADTVTSQPLLTVTAEASGATDKFRRFVLADGTRSVEGKRPLGVCRVKSSTDGDLIPVDVAGIVLVEAGAAIALADGEKKVQSDAQGRAVAAAGANPVAGVVLAAAAAAGDIVPILLAGGP